MRVCVFRIACVLHVKRACVIYCVRVYILYYVCVLKIIHFLFSGSRNFYLENWSSRLNVDLVGFLGDKIFLVFLEKCLAIFGICVIL